MKTISAQKISSKYYLGLIFGMYILFSNISFAQPMVDESSFLNEDAKQINNIILEDAIYFPNSFTPNGDGKNDEFMVSSEIIKRFSLRIFDEKGNEVFATTFLDNGWDGKYHGKEMKQSVYLYRIEATLENDQDKVMVGHLNLIR